MRQIVEQKTVQNEGLKSKGLLIITPFAVGLTLYTGGAAIISAIHMIEMFLK